MNPSSRFIIVTPSFNQAQFIAQTIDSVLAQTAKHREIIYLIQDGGSKDGTVEILKKYGTKIAWVSAPDGGQASAINAGIIAAQKLQLPTDHTYFAYINSDDYFLPESFDHVERMFATHPDQHWVVGDARIVNAENREIQRPIRLYKKIWRTIMPSWILFILNPYPQPSTFIRWSAVQKAGLFTEALRYTMDYEYWLRLRSSCGEPVLTDQALSAFRIHGLSKGGGEYTRQFVEELAVAQKYTGNMVCIVLHRLHNNMIEWVYKRIKGEGKR